MCEQADVRKYEIHDLRRSCITNWARKGARVYVVRVLAGHADLATTQKSDLNQASGLQDEVVAGIHGVAVTDPIVTPAAVPSGRC